MKHVEFWKFRPEVDWRKMWGPGR